MQIEIAKTEIIHFVGIGGIGMSGLALIMQAKGFKVQGSDININKTDFCITRGGASTLAELSLRSIPFLVVPLPTAKDNHQFENALYYKNNNSCWIIDQKNFNKKKLTQFFLNLLTNHNEYLKKKENLKKLNYQNSWNNVNQKILDTINAN